MPRGDRTGPWGFGPMTGRAAGYCAGYPTPGFMNPIPRAGRGFGLGWGRGFGRGRGRGRGWSRGFGRGWWTYPPQYRFPYPPPPYARASDPLQSPYGYPPMAKPQSEEQEIAALEQYKDELEADKADLEQELGAVESRIEELKTRLEDTEKEKPEP